MIDKHWNHSHIGAGTALKQLPLEADGRVKWNPKIRVAHLDTGYTEHPAFGDWTNDGRNDVILTELGRDFVTPSRATAKDPLRQTNVQEPGHGTRSGSALSARAAGYKGVAPGLPLVPCRVTDMSLVTKEVSKAIGRAINYVIADKVAPIISISLGFPFLVDSAMGRAIDKAYEAGIIVVAAGGQNIDRVTYPGKHRRTIGVAGIKRLNRQRSPKFRNYNPYDSYTRIDVWAPGDPIHRANVVEETPDKQFGDGTTYSTVHVVAAAAMWLQRHGVEIDETYMKRPKERWKRVEAFRRLLLTGGRLLPIKPPRDNVALDLRIDKLLRAPLPDPGSLVKMADLAIDDRH